MSTSRKRRKYSYSYLVEVRADYAEKLQDPQWSWLHNFFEEWGRELDKKIQTLQYTELCTHFQQEKILASILQQKNLPS